MTQSIRHFRVGRASGQYLERYDSAEMLAFFAEPDEVLRTTTGPIYKATFGDTSTVAVVDIDGSQYVVKRYNIKNWSHAIKRAILPSKAMVSWNNSLALVAKNIPSIQPVAVIEKKFGPLRGVSYFISEFVDGILARDYFAIDSPYQSDWPETMEKIVTLLKQLKKARISHDDFQWGNLIIVNHHPYILDLDHMRLHKHKDSRFDKYHQHDVDHFRHFLAASPAAQQLFQQQYLKLCR